MSEVETPEKKRDRPYGRWWDNYFVRYFFGTVVGAAIVLIIGERIAGRFAGSPTLRDFIDTLLFNAKGMGVGNLIGLGAFGLTYCYIASAPMLILHAGRALLFDPARVNVNNRFWILISVTGVSLCVAVCLLFRGPGRGLFITALPSFLFFCVQATLIVMAHVDRFVVIKDFYINLGQARSNELPGSEYVDSYRHLREHSNACAIIVLELVLACVLLPLAQSNRCLMVSLVAWLLPAGYCWFIASLLELAFLGAPTKQK